MTPNACSSLQDIWWKAKQKVWDLELASPLQPSLKELPKSGDIEPIPFEMVRSALLHQVKLNKARENEEAAFDDLVKCYKDNNLLKDVSSV